MAEMKPLPIIHFDYELSPIAQKTKLLLTAAGVPFDRVHVPPLIPRKDLQSIGITYRRVPILAVGKDIYCDSKVIFDVVLNKLATRQVPTSDTDGAWEQWGFNAFADTLGLVPERLNTEEFVNDRKTIYPLVARPDFDTLRPSAIADLHSRMDYLENTVLKHQPFIGGGKPSVADIHAIWGIRWDLHGADSKPPGLGATEPQVSKSQPVPQPNVISFDEAKKKIFESDYTSKVTGIWDQEPTDVRAGTEVTVDALGSEPYRHPVAGNLVSTSKSEIVLEVRSGLRLHFPRESQILRRAKL